MVSLEDSRRMLPFPEASDDNSIEDDDDDEYNDSERSAAADMDSTGCVATVFPVLAITKETNVDIRIEDPRYADLSR